MPGSHDNFTEESFTVTREDMQEYLDSGRPRKAGAPDRTKPHGKRPSDVRVFLKAKGMTSENHMDKMVGDLDSYL